MDSQSPVQSAEEQVLSSIDELLAQNDADLSVPMTKLNEAVNDVVQNQGKAIKRITDKILKAASRELVTTDNHIDQVLTGLLGGIDTWATDTHLLLQQLATKGGLTAIGEPLANALTAELTEGGKIEYMGTLVLAVKEAVPWLERIAVSLESIAKSLRPDKAVKEEQIAADQDITEEDIDVAAGELDEPPITSFWPPEEEI